MSRDTFEAVSFRSTGVSNDDTGGITRSLGNKAAKLSGVDGTVCGVGEGSLMRGCFAATGASGRWS
mgnify:CR=1 FL=1